MTALTSVSQAERPESQVGRSVGDAAQAVLDGVNGLVQEYICKVKLQNNSHYTQVTTLNQY